MYSPNRALLSIPWSINPYTLYYNKDIFDKFGVSYPKDGMTWDEVYALAKQVTRTVDGVQYRGFDMDNAGYIRNNPLSMNVIDPKTEQPVINSDAWKKYLGNLHRFYEIPGNLLEKMPNPDTAFYKDKTLAMRVGPNLFTQLKAGYDQGDRFNWDLVTLPVFPDKPATNIPWTGGLFTVSKHSKHKDAALQVIDMMLSTEVQLQGATLNRATVLKDQTVINAFGGGNEFARGKNVAAVGKYRSALGMEQTDYNAQAFTFMNAKFGQVRSGQKDMNTALREAEEEINKYITAEKKK
jgi:multiple sugar transport system substrate-binding protein